jgi:hypothetical protein
MRSLRNYGVLRGPGVAARTEMSVPGQIISVRPSRELIPATLFSCDSVAGHVTALWTRNRQLPTGAIPNKRVCGQNALSYSRAAIVPERASSTPQRPATPGRDETAQRSAC